MKPAIVPIIAILAAISASAIAAFDQASLSAADPSVRKTFLGFSILPPEGQGWHVQEQGFSLITHIKSPTNSGRYTVLVSARSRPIELKPAESKDFLGYVDRATPTTGEAPRYQEISKKISPVTIDHAECVRVDFSTKDRGVPYASGATYTMQGFDIWCLHPHFPQMLVELSHSQRFDKDIAPLALDKEVTSFLESLRFRPEVRKRFSIGPLLGSFAYDKAIFFPNGRNIAKETYLLSALKEGGYTKAEVFSPSQESVQKLAIEYDVRWLFGSKNGVTPELGCVLGKVDRWTEALQAFQRHYGAATPASEIRCRRMTVSAANRIMPRRER